MRLQTLYRERDAVAAAQAERRDAAFEIPLLERVEKGREHARAASANRMAERDGATVHVHLARIETQLAQHGNGLDRERLVQFDQIDILEGPSETIAPLESGQPSFLPIPTR